MDTELSGLQRKIAVVVALALALIASYAAQAQSFNGYTCEGLWEHIDAGGDVIFEDTNQWFYSSCTSDNEKAKADDGAGSPNAEKQEPRRTVVTCPALPPSVVVYGYVEGTQCQMVGVAGVGNAEVIQRGFINAVDIWSYVNGGIEVCFRSTGALVFLDAAYAPRMLMELPSFQRDGMTCGAIAGPGTVVLVRSGPSIDSTDSPAPATETTENTLPTFDAVPPRNDCQIKLTETLFLRAGPGGEIVGLVWLYSEVPVFEANGDWYKIEFEGRIGYISRHYHRVLRGSCV